MSFLPLLFSLLPFTIGEKLSIKLPFALYKHLGSYHGNKIHLLFGLTNSTINHNELTLNLDTLTFTTTPISSSSSPIFSSQSGPYSEYTGLIHFQSTTLQSYSPYTNTITSLTSIPPIYKGSLAHSCLTLNEDTGCPILYLIGGYDYSKKVSHYNIFKDVWTSLPDMINGRSDSTCEYWKGSVYAIGGSGTDTINVYDNQWNTFPGTIPSQGRIRSAIHPVLEQIIVITGMNTMVIDLIKKIILNGPELTNVYLNTVILYARYDDSFYVFGGQNHTHVLDTVERIRLNSTMASILVPRNCSYLPVAITSAKQSNWLEVIGSFDPLVVLGISIATLFCCVGIVCIFLAIKYKTNVETVAASVHKPKEIEGEMDCTNGIIQQILSGTETNQTSNRIIKQLYEAEMPKIGSGSTVPTLPVSNIKKMPVSPSNFLMSPTRQRGTSFQTTNSETTVGSTVTSGTNRTGMTGTTVVSSSQSSSSESSVSEVSESGSTENKEVDGEQAEFVSQHKVKRTNDLDKKMVDMFVKLQSNESGF